MTSMTMNPSTPLPTRRGFLRTLTVGAVAGTVPSLVSLIRVRGLFAEQLTLTPRQTEGPFYPNHLALDTDNDLLIINDSITPAVGVITHLSGRLLDARGNPIKNAVVEIWQVDNNGVYLHEGTANREKRDANFQGFGRFLTGSTGEYYFRTIKPVVYPGRDAPHIHFAVKMKGREMLTTQCYIKGHLGNERDGILNAIDDPQSRDSVIVDFARVEDSRIGELAARFDLVMGFTPGS